MLSLLPGPAGFSKLIFFAQVFSFILLNPYLCFISFLYIDIYALGDDALMLGVFMQTNLIHITVISVGGASDLQAEGRGFESYTG